MRNHGGVGRGGRVGRGGYVGNGRGVTLGQGVGVVADIAAYLPPVFVLPESPPPPQMIISVPVQTAV